jgi:hypothetical protein
MPLWLPKQDQPADEPHEAEGAGHKKCHLPAVALLDVDDHGWRDHGAHPGAIVEDADGE